MYYTIVAATVAHIHRHRHRHRHRSRVRRRRRRCCHCARVTVGVVGARGSPLVLSSHVGTVDVALAVNNSALSEAWGSPVKATGDAAKSAKKKEKQKEKLTVPPSQGTTMPRR